MLEATSKQDYTYGCNNGKKVFGGTCMLRMTFHAETLTCFLRLSRIMLGCEFMSIKGGKKDYTII